MDTQSVQRRLAAIFAADVEGYSRLMGLDELRTMRSLAERRETAAKLIAEHHGRIVDTAGDSILAEFASVVEAVTCALAVQRAVAVNNHDVEPAHQMLLRIGVHVGDVLVRGNELFGDGVNIASRLQALAEPGGLCISGVVYDEVRKKLTLAAADIGLQSIKNISEPVRAYKLQNASPANGDIAIGTTLPILTVPQKPSIAVLPFQNMSVDSEQEYFADGIAEDIITALSRSRWLFVVARNSSFTYKGKWVDIRQVGRELGVRYVLEGSVRKSGNRARISAQLISASDGHHVWADRYDRALEDIFTVQDEITSQITSAIAPGIVTAETQRTQAKDASELGTWERLMRAHWHIQRFNSADFRAASRVLDELLRIDPNNSTALSDLAFVLHFSASFAWADDPASSYARSREVARRAISADDKDPAAQAMAGIDELFARKHDDAIRRLRRAIELDPNSSFAHGMLSSAYAFAGEADIAIEQAQTAIRLSPRDFLNVIWHVNQAWAHLSAGRLQESADCARRAIDSNPAFPDAHGILTSAEAHLGHDADARSALDAFIKLIPESLAAQLAARPFRRLSDRERYLAGLRKAGLPEQ